MKEFYRVIQASEFCKSPIKITDFADIESALKGVKRVLELGYNGSSLQKIQTII